MGSYPCDKDNLPNLSIGQVIEFLIEHHPVKDTYIVNIFSFVASFGLEDQAKEVIEIGWSNNMGKSEEFCDALWEAVKNTIEIS